jgi:hypothetical protein
MQARPGQCNVLRNRSEPRNTGHCRRNGLAFSRVLDGACNIYQHKAQRKITVIFLHTKFLAGTLFGVLPMVLSQGQGAIDARGRW